VLCQGKICAYSGASCPICQHPCGELLQKSEGHMVAKSRGVRQDWARRTLGGKQSKLRCPVEHRLTRWVSNSPPAAVGVVRV
jgi:hypothetical protein